MTLALLAPADARTDTIYLVNTQQPRGRHAATRKPGQENPDQLSVGAICLIYGAAQPVRTDDHHPGRHAADEDTTAIVVSLF